MPAGRGHVIVLRRLYYPPNRPPHLLTIHHWMFDHCTPSCFYLKKKGGPGRFTKIKRKIKIWGLAERVGTSSPLGDVLIWKEIENQNFLYYFLGNSFHHLSQKNHLAPFNQKKTSFPNRHISKPTKKSVLQNQKKKTPIAEPRLWPNQGTHQRQRLWSPTGRCCYPTCRESAVAGWTTPPMPTLNPRNKTLIRPN